MKNSFNYKKIAKETEKWFSRASEAWMFEKPRKELAEYLADPSIARYGPLTAFGQLAAWHARKACLFIHRGDRMGWGCLMSFLRIRAGSLRLEVEGLRLRKGIAPHNADPTRTPFHLLAMAIELRDESEASWIGDQIIEARNTLMFGYDWGGKRSDFFRCYICELYARGEGEGSFPDNFVPYAPIFEYWEDPDKLAEAIRAACNYHIAQIDVEDGVFENNPHDIFPAEILALYRVREKLGLETPAVSHPLLDTPFSQVPENITYEPDPLVEDAMKLAMELLPQAVDER